MLRDNERALSGFEKRWLRLFAAGAAKPDLERCVTAPGAFIWHVFAFNLIPEGSYLEGDEARKAFDASDKEGAKYFKPFSPAGSPGPKYHSPDAADLDRLTECYVIAADKSWTYIKTHEGDAFGPYFCRRSGEGNK